MTRRERQSVDEAAGFVDHDRRMIDMFVFLTVADVKLDTLYYFDNVDGSLHVFASSLANN